MTRDASPLIRLRNIARTYDTPFMETHALHDVSLDIGHGECVAITGPSGSGKSTLLAILGLLDEASEGDYWLEGHHVASLDAAQCAQLRNREIGFVYQAFNLLGDLSVEENVALPLRYRRELSAGERRVRVEEALERVGLLDRRHHRPAQLSGGQQQRVAVARAVAGKPSLLLADEPTGNLDSRNGAAVMELLGSLNEEGTTVVLVTHDDRYLRFAARTIALLDGALVDLAVHTP
ncbi:ABC transporter ATP-binding protein [Gemmatimonas aurantiaca]|uniref:ABC transporter ATP-binding protein n=1 Tax=Gemmatimonas aurantiaca TaxID=173480 RepID=UPI00301BA31E